MNAGEGVEKREPSCTVGGNRNWYIHYGEHYGGSLKSKNRATMWSWWLRQWRICLQRRRLGFDPWVGKIPWRREWQLTPAFLLRDFHGQRSLAGYSPWDRKELGMAEWLTYTHTWSRNPTPGHISSENHNSKRYMHPSVRCSNIHNSQDMSNLNFHQQRNG